LDKPFDAAVVGSGFGASVVAYRLAKAGKNVRVLERGKKYPPGSFPRSPRDVSRNLWDPQSGLYGMFDLWSFSGIESLVSSGLGGGSLIYANVLLRKPPAWFVDELPDGGYQPWPVSYESLEPHYEQVEEVLGAQEYPFDDEPYNQTPKTIAMNAAADALHLEWALPKLAVTFANPGQAPVPGEPILGGEFNLHRRPRDTCRLCGECDIGCNYGSKNTLDYTYLSRAEAHGAEICTLAEVRRIEPVDDGYEVTYVQHDAADDRRRPKEALPHNTLTAKRLVLGAGTYGSTYLLLRNRSAFPKISPALGTRFSGNGDLLTFLRNATITVNGVRVPRWLNPGYGPVITSAIFVPDELDGTGRCGRGFYIEDGGHPQFLNWLDEVRGMPHILFRGMRFGVRRVAAHALRSQRSNVSGDVAALVGGGVRSSTWLPLLAMGRDTPDGRMRLRRGNLDLDWTMQSSKGYYAGVEATLASVAQKLGAKLSKWPLRLFKRVITVHPLGGCPMGCSPEEGVVNDQGEVFGYPGLYVVDGSVMRGPVGPNPSLTIAAFANRAANGMLGLPV
jgi:cholesterol oxidase